LLSITKLPRLIESAFNPILFDISYSNYKLGDMFYLDLKNEHGEILDELQLNGNGLGYARFDISSAIQAFFPTPKLLNTSVIMQKDETAIIPYKVEIGLLRVIDKQKLKYHCYSSDNFYALRSALPNDDSQSIANLTIDYLREAEFLTSVTPEQTRGAELFLPVLVQAPTTVRLVCDYYTSRKETVHTLNSLGVFVFNVQPELQGVIASGFSAWLEADTPVYVATMKAMTVCDIGLGSYTASITKSSTISLSDAQNKALTEAATIAASNLTCDLSSVATFTATASYTTTCSDGFSGTYTATVTRTSTISQADADTKAQAAAKTEAEANLVCSEITTYSATASYTTICPYGTEGSSYTATVTRTSTISQADAASKAQSAAQTEAEANIVCTPVSANWQPRYEENGCFSGRMYDMNGIETERVATTQEYQTYSVEYANDGSVCPFISGQ
jgi:hypothetical protein